jgi:hypothetical protein
MNYRIYLISFILISLFSLNYASDSLSSMVGSFEDYISMGLTIVIIHLFLVSLAYMYSNFFMSDELKVWSKNEIIQAIYSIIILGSFISFFLLINSFAGVFFADVITSSNVGGSEASIDSFCFNTETNRWISDPTKCEKENHQIVEADSSGGVVCKDGTGKILDGCNPMFLMARSYLGIAFERLANLHKILLRNYSLMNAMNSMGNYISAGEGDGGLNWGASVNLIFRTDGIYIAMLETLILFVEKILLMLKFQESVLKFMEFGLAFYLIALGLIFRSIFVFRKFGGLLLSLGICFMFVLPLLYILGWYTLSIPNIEIVLTENFSDSFEKADFNWITASYIISFIPYAILRVLEFLQPTPITPASLPMAIFKTVVDVFVIASNIIMTVQYYSTVVANNMDFYFTNYSEVGDTYEVDGMKNIGVLDYISRFLIIALAVPLLNIYMFFAFVRGLSPFLGGDAEIPALGRFL